ncbi:MAG: amidase family protein [Solirubrobacterales bacterium]
MLRRRELSSRELTELYLDRIERIDPNLNAYRDVWGERAIAEADAADRRRGAGTEAPLLGVPIAIKDNIDVAGDVTGHGTDAFDRPAERDSILVTSLREAGAVILGKTNLPELAIHGYTESETNGITRNPWNRERGVGGSSGGSGAAVAAGLAALSHASDGAGSIRHPAAQCGLFGLKPQRDRVPIDGVSWTGMSGHGCNSRTVADTALFLDAVTAGPAHSPNAPPPPERPFAESAASPPEKLRIAVSLKAPRALAPPILSDEARRAVEETGELLRSLGHEVGPRDPAWGLVGNQAAARYLGGIAEDFDAVPRPERLEPITRGYRRIARFAAPGWALRRALRLEGADRERINRLFDDHDVLLMPVVAGPAFEHGRYGSRGALRCLLGESRFYPYCIPWNHTGQPAASVPAGRSSEDLPLAVQLVGRVGDEATLLSLAAQLEAERPWADRRPQL